MRRMWARIKTREQIDLDALKEAQARNARFEHRYGPISEPTPIKPKCTCPKSLDDVRTYGKRLYLGEIDGVMQFTVCPDAWARLLTDAPVPQTSAALHIVTVAGTIQIMKGDKHV